MNVASKQRSVTRGIVTKILNSVPSKLGGVLSADEVQALICALSTHKETLVALDREIQTQILDDAALDADLNKAGEYTERLVECLSHLQARACSLQAAAVLAANSAIPMNPNSSVGASGGSSHGFSRHLPKQQLSEFSGDPRQWHEFWDDYKITVHDAPDIGETRKFKYLRQVLKGPALDLIKGLPLSDVNYQQAITLLKERFGDPQVSIFAHFEALLSIPEASHDIDRLRSVFNESEAHVRSLVALGLQEDTFGQVFVPILLSKMPKYVRVELHRKNGSDKWTLPKLRQLLRDEIDARERADHQFMNPKSDAKSTESRHKPSMIKGAQRASGSALVTNSDLGKPKPFGCTFCGKDHYSEACDVYTDYASRMGRLNDRCMCCLGRNHKAKECRRKRPCKFCKKENHHSSVCREEFPKRKENTAVVGADLCESEESDSHDSVNAVSAIASGYRSMMQTALAKIQGRSGQASARFVFDTASSRSFITKAKAGEIGAKQVGEEIVSVGRFRENKRSTIRYKIVEFDAVNHSGEKKSIQCAVSDVITTPIQLYALDEATQAKLRHLRLSEPLFAEAVSVTVDILLGLDWYFQFIEEQQIRLANGLVFMSSFFGYVGGGQVSGLKADGAESNLFTFVTRSPAENFELEKFWSLEDLGIKDSPANDEDELALAKFQKSLQFKDNRFWVKWPFKEGIPEMQSNFGLAFGRLKSLIRRHANDPSVIDRYEKTFRDQLAADIIEVAPLKPTGVEHYIPHQCVIKTTSNTTKFRVVMDASAKSSTQKRSLNDCFYHCPLILSDLVGILLRIRLAKVALVGDIEKAYLQTGLQESERDCTRFLWIRDRNKAVDQGNLVVFRFKRVPFGFSPSAFLLGGSVDVLLLKEGTTVAMDIRDNIFVDNVFGGRQTVAEAVSFVTEAIRIFGKASMNLREWYSNSAAVIESLPITQRGTGTATKVLGLKWDTHSDCFFCPVGTPEHVTIRTKRQILKAIATVFDPCGFFAPVTVHAKILMQRLWALKIGWDDEVPQEELSRWVTCSTSLQQIPSVAIARQLEASVYVAGSQRELHCFCDASTKAYAAAVYLRIRNETGTFSNLIMCKSRVNPVKPLNVPRLELMAALVGSRLVKFAERELHLPVSRKVLWSDSKCTLHWIRGKQTYTRFVENRLKEIRSVPDLQFRYVPTQENPADLPSRGTSTEELRQTVLWWHGPKFLCEEEAHWPAQDISDWKVESLLEQNAGQESEKTDTALVVPGGIWLPKVKNPILDCSKYSALRKLLRVTAFVFRFTFREPVESQSLTPDELSRAQLYWVKVVQAMFLEELMTSTASRFINKRKQLGLFVDDEGVIRCRGRLENSDLSFEARNPVLLPKDSHFTRLVILLCHEQVFHSGAQHTLAKLRDKFWIPDGRSTIQKVLRGCNLCRKHHGGPFRIPDPPPLPAFRVSRSRPFSNVGLDYLGPLFVKEEGKSKKVWICLFTCAATRAIHLEVVSSLTTRDFLLCLRRFMALYGVPDIVVSDNAKQFHSANRVAKRMWADARKDAEVRDFVATQGIQWKFITQLAPWMGGMYERLVSPVKRALKKCLDKRCVNIVELQTVGYEVARVVNSRPLKEVDSEVGTLILTPAHFILRDSSYVPSGGTHGAADLSADSTVREWKRCQELLDSYWRTWRREYLAELRARLWSHHQRDTSVQEPRVGAVVQIAEKLPRGVWRLGRVIQLISGADGKVRSAVVRMANGNQVTRSLKFLHPLELDKEPSPKPRNRMPAIQGLDSEAPTDSSDEE